MAGRPCEGVEDQGSIVCACFQVGEKRIRRVLDQGSQSVESLGRHLGCGTNCGSCIPELKALIAKSKG
ncbi:(2Fe-2S)-binding protein [Marinobacterium aestuariivivens]|uniref:Bacterioferritin-associated ferredoxin n=1 Tax=Marinobacterium aestuariivivens TaxID=1698799 RepID=A0ABW2A5J7_9GAMM